ncbi:SOS response-associated peptidase family protein [Sphingomonas canadensis]|uniref:SOS response-associated peptidase family protein n=1 Tax=Sphingomonas canadensis TaxID=1219257 RepID=A0ABW3HD00_9SPHN|nr:SOS response-associated peptidase family protein [Sphingomonas canadensis]MCW3838158.1 SOS response-associated peptidase family protein [Sphingomonas canadensis]
MEVTPFESEAPFGSRKAIIRRNPQSGKPQVISAAWGLDAWEPGGKPFKFVRSEGRTFPHQRCLVPASEFQVKNGDRKFRVTLDDGNFFYMAGIWRPSSGDQDTGYAIITIEANPDIFFYQERQGAVILRRHNMAWLDGMLPESELLRALPPRSFQIEEVGPRGLDDRQRRLAS